MGRELLTRRQSLFVLGLLLGLGMALRFYKRQSQASRVVYINQTTRKENDLNFLLSLKTARKKSNIEFALVMLKQLPAGETMEAYAHKFLNESQIGSKNQKRGILLLYDESQSALKIEVTYALEALFPDILCHHIAEAAREFALQDNMGDFFTEILVNMSHYVQKNEGGKYVEGAFPVPATAKVRVISSQLSGGAGVLEQNLSQKLNARFATTAEDLKKLSTFSPGKTVQETVDAYLDSLKAGVFQKELPLLTDSSRFFRTEYPRNESYMQQSAKKYQEAMPYSLYEKGDLAAALFKENNPVWPIYLRKISGLWYVDEAKSWAYTHFYEDSAMTFHKHEDHPYQFAWEMAGRANPKYVAYPKSIPTPELLDSTTNLLDHFQKLEDKIKAAPQEAKVYFDMAESLYFDCYCLKESLPYYEKGLELDPLQLGYRWRVIEVAMNVPDTARLIVQIQELKKRDPENPLVKKYYKHFKKSYGF